jgi:hypothetical protein
MPCNPNGMTSHVLSVRPVDFGGVADWVDALDTAIASWNATGSGANISKSPTAVSTVTVDWDAQVNINILGAYGRNSATSFHINLYDANVNLVAGVGGSVKSSIAVWDVTHELGHALRLVDNPAVGLSSSVMDYVFPPRVVSPTVFDRENVWRCFP